MGMHSQGSSCSMECFHRFFHPSHERVVNKMFVYTGLNNFKMHWPAMTSLWEASGTARNSHVFLEGCFIYGVHGCCHYRPC